MHMLFRWRLAFSNLFRVFLLTGKRDSKTQRVYPRSLCTAKKSPFSKIFRYVWTRRKSSELTCIEILSD